MRKDEEMSPQQEDRYESKPRNPYAEVGAGFGAKGKKSGFRANQPAGVPTENKDLGKYPGQRG
jgi:hypothetical protein